MLATMNPEKEPVETTPRWLTELRAQMAQVTEQLTRIEAKLQPAPICLSFEDAAAKLGVCSKTLGKMIRRGQIRTSTIGDRQKISLAELERVSTPDEERPKVERRQRAARWVPVDRTPPPRRPGPGATK